MAIEAILAMDHVMLTVRNGEVVCRVVFEGVRPQAYSSFFRRTWFVGNDVFRLGLSERQAGVPVNDLDSKIADTARSVPGGKLLTCRVRGRRRCSLGLKVEEPEDKRDRYLNLF